MLQQLMNIQLTCSVLAMLEEFVVSQMFSWEALISIVGWSLLIQFTESWVDEKKSWIITKNAQADLELD